MHTVEQNGVLGCFRMRCLDLLSTLEASVSCTHQWLLEMIEMSKNQTSGILDRIRTFADHLKQNLLLKLRCLSCKSSNPWTCRPRFIVELFICFCFRHRHAIVMGIPHVVEPHRSWNRRYSQVDPCIKMTYSMAKRLLLALPAAGCEVSWETETKAQHNV